MVASSLFSLSLMLTGSQVTSELPFSATMHPLYYIAFTVLASVSFLSSVFSIQCNDNQYPWPVTTQQFCCDKCRPGYHMNRGRPENSCKIYCEVCPNHQYTDSYNVEMSCRTCNFCNKPNMEYKVKCSTTHNAVCGCTAGYRCNDQSCSQCVKIAATTKPTLPPSTTTTTPHNT
uniref:CD27 antigen n=1 Tax=Monopterus albus TaxID=43700 RepID=UPI0009B35A96|nr:CD27 antigen-like [Monopterus albus]